MFEYVLSDPPGALCVVREVRYLASPTGFPKIATLMRFSRRISFKRSSRAATGSTDDVSDVSAI